MPAEESKPQAPDQPAKAEAAKPAAGLRVSVDGGLLLVIAIRGPRAGGGNSARSCTL